jgi:hypothetical protein
LIFPGTQWVRRRIVTDRNFPSSANAGSPEITALLTHPWVSWSDVSEQHAVPA